MRAEHFGLDGLRLADDGETEIRETESERRTAQTLWMKGTRRDGL